MQKFWRFFLLAVTGLALMILSPPLLGRASEVQATGIDVNSAVIKDAQGNTIGHDVQLTPGEYIVNYSWSIPNGATVKAGDTMTFTLPPNVHIPADDDFTAYTSSGVAIGTVHIGTGSSSGVMTFNRYFQYNPLNRHGWLKINVPVEAPPAAPISMSKTASWVDPKNPTVINWELTINHNGGNLTNPVVKDTFSSNQKYVAGSVHATVAGQNVAVTASGSLFTNSMTFKLSGVFSSDITLNYQTQTKSPTGAETFNNNANYSDSEGRQANAAATITREAAPSNPGPSEPDPQEPVTMDKSVSWADPHDQSKLNWDITVNAHNNQLINPQIVDHLSANQAYVPNSAKMTTASGQPILLATSVSGAGRSLVFKAVGTFTTNLYLTYQSAITLTRGLETYTNNANYTDDAGHEASAAAKIDRLVEPAKTPISMTKAVTWADPNDQTKLSWNLTVSSNGNQLVNPVITDHMSPNQTFIPDSAIAVTVTGETIPVTATVNGNEVTFKIPGTYTTDFQLAYQTRTNDPISVDRFANDAVYEDDAGNQAAANTAIDREIIEGSEGPEEPGEPEPEVPITMTKTATWLDPTDHTKINWALTIATHGQQLSNPVITDQLSDNQTYVVNSVTARDTLGQVPVIASVNGHQLTFKLIGEFSTDVQLTYQTTTNTPTGADTFTNAAVVNDDANHHAEANTSIEREGPPVEPAKDPISLTKTAAWSDPNDQNRINWQLEIKTNGNTLKNPVVTDVFSNNQTYVTDSAKAVDATGKQVPTTVTINGQTLTIAFTGELTSDLTLTYQTTTNEATGAATFDNAAIVDDDNNNHAGGGSSIDREAPPTPAKVPIEVSKEAAWNGPNDMTTINWTIGITANGNTLINPVITDTFSNNQTYLNDSAKAIDEAGQVLPVSASVTDHTLTFKIAGTVTNNFDLTYQTKTNAANGAAVFDNAVLYTDDNDNNGSATTEIDRPDLVTEPEEPSEPSEPTEPGEPGSPNEPNSPETPGQPTPPVTPSQPGEPEKPGVTEPVKPETKPTEPETTTPVKPGVTEPTKPSAPALNKPVPATPAVQAQRVSSRIQAKAQPSSATSTSEKLPQTDENYNAMIDTIIGVLAIFFGIGLGYFDLRRH